jgi:ppGpp synthetase/RelA/SpoT-type nucleotidyltranferase
VFRGTAIQTRGILAVTPERWAGANEASRTKQTGALISGLGPTVPAQERQIAVDGKMGTAVETPSQAKDSVRQHIKANGGRAGIILLDAQQVPVAFVPWTGADALPLKGNGKLDALYRAVSLSNAGGALIGTGSDMTLAQAQNLARGLAQIDVRTLDIIDSDNKSAMERGYDIRSSVLLSRATPERQAKIEKAARTAASVMPKFVVDDAVQLAAKYPGPPAVDVPVTTRVRLQAMLKPLMAAAEEANEQFKADLRAAAAEVGGTAKTAGVKAEKRTIEKLHQEEEITGREATPDDIKDLVRGSIVVQSEEDIPSAIQEVRDRFNVIRVKDRFSEPLASGYRDVLINVRLPNGSVGEVQIHIPAMLAAKELGHLLYQVERALPPGAEKMALEEAQARFYGEAYDSAGRFSNSLTSEAKSASDTSPPPYATLEAGTSRPDTADTARPPGSSTTGPAPSTSSNRDPSGRDFQSNATSRSFAGPSDAPILSRVSEPQGEYADIGDPFSGDYKALRGRQVEIKAATLDAAQAMRDLDERRDLAQRLVACVG